MKCLIHKKMFLNPSGTSQIEHCSLYYKISYANMEGLRELRGMVVFLSEETTRGYTCYSTGYADYAAHLTYTTLYKVCLMKHTHYADYTDKMTYA